MFCRRRRTSGKSDGSTTRRYEHPLRMRTRCLVSMARAGFRLGARFGVANEITSKIGPLAKMSRPFGSLAPPFFLALPASILTVQRRESDSAGHG